MGRVLIRNLDDRVIESLKTKAGLKGHSLEQELRDVLANAAPLAAGREGRFIQQAPCEDAAAPRYQCAIGPVRRGRDDEFDE